MMTFIWVLALLFIIHYIGDFFVQIYTWKSAKRAVKNLMVHTLSYIFVLICGIIVIEAIFPKFVVHYHDFLFFILINFVLHFFTDIGTKRVTKILKEHNELTAYVNAVALDQMIHYITLIITFGLFFVAKIGG